MSGWKQWGIGEVVEAGDLQTYIQDQTVQKYASAAARTTALGTAVSEGMVSYLQDSNSVQVYDGSAWQAIAPISGNYIINGAFDIWQRGTSFSLTSTAYTSDRWQALPNAGGATVTYSQQSFTPADLSVVGFGEANYFIRVSTPGGNTGQARLTQKIEDVRTLAGQTVAYSMWLKADGTKNLRVRLLQNFGSGGSSDVTVISQDIELTTSWQRFTFTASVPTISGKTIGSGNHLVLQFLSEVNQAIDYDIWGVQLEAGSVATPFKRHAPSLQGELAACQRYYWQDSFTNVFAQGVAVSTTLADFLVSYPVTMRTAPASITVTNAGGYRVTTSADLTGTFALNSPSQTRSIVRFTSSGMTQGEPMALRTTSSGTIAFSAEL